MVLLSPVALDFAKDSGKTTMTLFGDRMGNGIKVTYENNNLIIDRSGLNSGQFSTDPLDNVLRIPLSSLTPNLTLELLLDRYSLEGFINDGEQVFTLTTMTEAENYRFFAQSDTPITMTLTSADIIV